MAVGVGQDHWATTLDTVEEDLQRHPGGHRHAFKDAIQASYDGRGSIARMTARGAKRTLAKLPMSVKCLRIDDFDRAVNSLPGSPMMRM
jgi:hypothetical protein